MRVFLVGYMGSGKSRWGKMIARHYDWDFIDLDALIEESEQMSIPEIFATYNESGFRERERNALLSVSSINNVIVATGGGAPCYGNNMEIMNEIGETLYIEGTPELLRERILNSKTERPLVKNYSPVELLEYIKNHLQTRLPYYTRSKYQITTGDLELSDFIHLLDPIIASNH